MKKQISETDFIGGESPLTKAEELALAQYFAKKKKKASPKTTIPNVKTNNRSSIIAVPLK